MKSNLKHPRTPCPVTAAALVVEARERLEKLLDFCQQSELTLWKFEKCLLALLAILGRVLVRLFLTARHERLDLQPYLEGGAYRLGNPYAERRLKTPWGEVRYGRAHFSQRPQGSGFQPLDVVLGLTRDRLSPWVMQLVGRLASRTSFWCDALGVPGLVALVFSDRYHRAGGVGSLSIGGTFHPAVSGARQRRRRAGH